MTNKRTIEQSNPDKIPTQPLASRGSSYFNGIEIAFTQIKTQFIILAFSL
ncbi:MAG: hypothetical protein JXR36_17365 [Bacteroidales bacterium]|nr:hypothetical protein [Bacteroidales bacterium]